MAAEAAEEEGNEDGEETEGDEDEEEMLVGGDSNGGRQDKAKRAAGGSREVLMARKAELEQAVGGFRRQLAEYSADDPVELERKENEVRGWAAEAETETENIYSIEGWFRRNGFEEHLAALRMSLYGEQGDEEAGGVLRELV